MKFIYRTLAPNINPYIGLSKKALKLVVNVPNNQRVVDLYTAYRVLFIFEDYIRNSK